MAGGAGFYDITVGANLIVLVITFWPGRFFYFDDRLLSAHVTWCDDSKSAWYIKSADLTRKPWLARHSILLVVTGSATSSFRQARKRIT